MIQEGKKAPAFSLPSSAGGKVKLSDYLGSTVVLYFYPRDNTPGCTTEAIDFQRALPALRRLGAEVLGVSRDSLDSHRSFAEAHHLRFPLLSDPDAKIIEKYGAWAEKNLYGKKSMGIVRTTVIIGPDGRVRRVFSKVRVPGHVAAVVEAVRAISKER
jgi:thioredoxin-dependent peroxiredoxin